MSDNKKTFKVGDNEVAVTVKKRLSLPEVVGFVNNVVAGCIGDNVYFPEMVSFLVTKNMLFYYAGVETSGELQEQYDFVYSVPRDMMIEIVNQIDCDQLEDIKRAIDKKLDYQARRSASKSRCDELFDALIRFVENLEKNLDFKDVKGLMSELAHLKLDNESVMRGVLDKLDAMRGAGAHGDEKKTAHKAAKGA